MPAGSHRPSEGRFKRLLWFIVIYGASLAAFTVIVYGLRGLIPR